MSHPTPGQILLEDLAFLANHKLRIIGSPDERLIHHLDGTPRTD